MPYGGIRLYCLCFPLYKSYVLLFQSYSIFLGWVGGGGGVRWEFPGGKLYVGKINSFQILEEKNICRKGPKSQERIFLTLM